MNHLKPTFKNNQWYQYLFIFFMSFVVAGIIGFIPLLVANYATKPTETIGFNPFDLTQKGIEPNLGLFMVLLPFIIGLWFAVKLIKRQHDRNFSEIVNGTSTVRWQRFFFALIVGFMLMVLWQTIDYFLHPDLYLVQFNAGSFFIFFVVSVLFIPFQTTLEEILFRGYLSQGIAASTKNRWLVIAIPSVLFGLLHLGNPEVEAFGFWQAMPGYLLPGIALGLLTVLDDGIELAMGIHAANNIFSSTMLTFEASAIKTPALFYLKEVDPIRELLVMFLFFAVFLLICYQKYKWNLSILNQRIK